MREPEFGVVYLPVSVKPSWPFGRAQATWKLKTSSGLPVIGSVLGEI
jgi:hypothetical protein